MLLENIVLAQFLVWIVATCRHASNNEGKTGFFIEETPTITASQKRSIENFPTAFKTSTIVTLLDQATDDLKISTLSKAEKQKRLIRAIFREAREKSVENEANQTSNCTLHFQDGPPLQDHEWEAINCVTSNGFQRRSNPCPLKEGCDGKRNEHSSCISSRVYYPKLECYNSIQLRFTTCKSHANECLIMESSRCLNNLTCFGQWSAWSDYSDNCSQSCSPGVKQRKRFCYRDGELAAGHCFGGGYMVTNQSDTVNCSKLDCSGKKGFPFPFSPTNEYSTWSYLFYGSIVLLFVVVSSLLAVGGYFYSRKTKKPHATGQESPSPPSSSVVVTEATGHHNAAFRQSESTFNQVEEDDSIVANEHHMFESNATGASLFKSVPKREATKTFSGFRRLPSLPKSVVNNDIGAKKESGAINYTTESEKPATRSYTTFEHGFKPDENNKDESSYTRMKSFNSAISTKTTFSKSSSMLYNGKHQKTYHTNVSRIQERKISGKNSTKRHVLRGSAARATKRKSFIPQRNKVHSLRNAFEDLMQSNDRAGHLQRATSFPADWARFSNDKQEVTAIGQSTSNPMSSCSFQNKKSSETDQNGYLIPLKLPSIHQQIKGTSFARQECEYVSIIKFS